MKHITYAYRAQRFAYLVSAFIALAATGCATTAQGSEYTARLAAAGRATFESAPNPNVDAESLAPLLRAPVLDRTALIRAVLDRNPTIGAAQQAWRGVLARYPQATALGDPRVSYRVAPGTIGSSAVDDFGQNVLFTQPVPFPGKLQLQGAIVLAEAEAAQHQYETVRRELALIASILFDDYYVVRRSLDVNVHHATLLTELKQSAEVQYTAGRASQQDPLQGEVELVKLLQQKLALETALDVVRAQLNGLLHRAPNLPLPEPPRRLALPAAVPQVSQELYAEALRNRSELDAIRGQLRAAESTLALAKREYFPDFAVSSGYNSLWDADEKRFTVGVAFDLPLQIGKRRGAVVEANAGLLRLRNQYAALADTVQVEVQRTASLLAEAHEVARLYQDRLVPAATDQAAAARAGFETGRNSFLAPIEAEKTLRTVELGFHAAVADVHRRQARLDRALGRAPGLTHEGDAQ